MFNLFKPKFDSACLYDAMHIMKCDQNDIERIFARLFSSEDGRKALAYLQVTSFHRTLAPSAPDAEIRYAEGRRSLVAFIMRLIEKGKNQ